MKISTGMQQVAVRSPHFSYWPRPASRPGGASRQEKVEERSTATVEAFDAAGGPPGRDPEGGAVPPTGCVTPLARCDGIAPRGVPALSGGQRRAGRGQYEKGGLAGVGNTGGQKLCIIRRTFPPGLR